MPVNMMTEHAIVSEEQNKNEKNQVKRKSHLKKL